jgi:hypothetical protein
MPEVIAYFLERQSCFDQMARASVPKAVRSPAFGGRQQPTILPFDNVVEATWRKRLNRSTKSEKDDPAETCRTALMQIACNRVADRRFQGKPLLPARLGPYYSDLTLLPVNVLEAKAADLAGTQSTD